jgi:hypothetical protein
MNGMRRKSRLWRGIDFQHEKCLKMDKSICKTPNPINFHFPTVKTVGYGNAIPTIISAD